MSYEGSFDHCQGCTRPLKTGDKYRYIRLHAENVWICDGCFEEILLAIQARKKEYEATLRQKPI